MRGADRSNAQLFGYVDIESRIASKPPLRLIREVVNDCLASLSPEFERLYARRVTIQRRYALRKDGGC